MIYSTRLFFLFLLLFIIQSIRGQQYFGAAKKKTEKFLFFDKSGNQYNLNDLRVDRVNDPRTKSINTISTTSCNAGYYNLYFETGSGMEGSTSIEIARRNVICQLFSDLSTFINSPLTSSGSKVNIWVRDIANMGVSTPSINPTLGVGSQFYCVPNIQFISGIADNMIYQTILSGKDAYTNVAPPLYTGTSNGGNYYHGALAFNFLNPSFSFHTNLSLQNPTNDYDLYSVALHEIMHALGFGSLIDQNGQSKFGSIFPYYSRYDQSLKTQANVPLIVNTTTLCSMYNYTFNPILSASILQPGFTSTSSCTPDSTICGSAINYDGSVTQPVYTPDCFSSGSTLSHFEDQCQVPASFTVTPSNNKYFVMSNAYKPGPVYMKRYLKPEERSVLCDLGYNVNTTFGLSSNLNYFNYGGSACSGIQVAGINDGITSSGSYTYLTGLNTPIILTGLLGNDFNASVFECLEVIDGTGTLSTSSGTIATYTPASYGAHLLRYVPVSTLGNRGNITYVFVFVTNGTCTPSSCDLINNGGFEFGVNCGQLWLDTPLPLMDCWYKFNDQTPDFFVRGCIPNIAAFTVPTTYTPSIDTWNNVPNNNFLGLAAGYGGYSDGVIGQLSSGIQPGASYQLNFVARTTDFFSNVNSSCYVMFAGSNNLSVPFGSPLNSLPIGQIELNRTFIPANNQWNFFSTIITNTTTTIFNYLTVLNPAFVNTLVPICDFLIDDVSLKQINSLSTFTVPSSLCPNQIIPDLSIYAPSPGGNFTGTGVTYSLGLYSFKVPSPGVYNIYYSYGSCLNMSIATVTVGGPIVSINGSSFICKGDTVSLNASGADTYTWNTGSNSSSILISPSTTTNYSVIGTNTITGCTNVANITLTVDPIPLIISTSSLICSGQSATLSAGGANVYYWDNGATTSSIVTTPTITTTYTLTGTTLKNCPFTVFFTQSVTCIGIEDYNSSEIFFNIHPNPVSNNLYIESKEMFKDGTDIEITNTLGQTVLKSLYKNEIDVSQLSNGYYVLKIISPTKQHFYSKFVKQ